MCAFQAGNKGSDFLKAFEIQGSYWFLIKKRTSINHKKILSCIRNSRFFLKHFGFDK